MPPRPSTIDSPKGSLYRSHLLQSPRICFCPLFLKWLPLLYKSLKSSKSRDGCDFVTTKFKALCVLWGLGRGGTTCLWPNHLKKKCLIKEVWRPFVSLQGLLLQLFPLMAGAEQRRHQYLAATQTTGHRGYPEECPHQQWHKEASLLMAWHHAVAREVPWAWPEIQAVDPVPGAEDCSGLCDHLYFNILVWWHCRRHVKSVWCPFEDINLLYLYQADHYPGRALMDIIAHLTFISQSETLFRTANH